MSIYSKIKWVFGIGLVIALIAVTNTIDKQNFSTIKDAVIAIYEDRLIAKNIVFDLSTLIHQKEVATVTQNAPFFTQQNAKVNESIDQLINEFSATKLTTKEERVFEKLKADVTQLQQVERRLDWQNQTRQSDVRKQLQQIKKHLTDLSEIQLKEGKQQLFISRDAVNQIEQFTKIENGMLIFLALLMIFGVVYQPKQT